VDVSEAADGTARALRSRPLQRAGSDGARQLTESENSAHPAADADDRPYGLIEGSVLRDDVPPAEIAWQGTPGFC
jgi:hypothetical protein